MAGKTNAIRLVQQAGISCEEAFYEYDENDLSGTHAADAIGMPQEQVFKTLVARDGKGNIHVFCIPVCCELDLKKAASAAGEKSIELVAVKELLALNEGLTENTILSIGDEIVITIPEPELSMTTVEESTYEEDYYAEPEYILNDEWYTTQKVVRQKGVPGHHVVTALITRENNKETERRIIAETVTAEPVVEIIEKVDTKNHAAQILK